MSVAAALVLAGGRGVRLQPYTLSVPKPLLHVKGKTLVEHVLDGLRALRVARVYVSVRYLGSLIEGHLGARYRGMDLCYLRETTPLGTAGPLGLLPADEADCLVVNSDVLADPRDVARLVRAHGRGAGALTCATKRFELRVPYGVVEARGTSIRAIREKPALAYEVLAGLYVVGADVRRRLVPRARRVDMPDLIRAAIRARRPVRRVPLAHPCLEIGTRADYEATLAGGLLGGVAQP